MFQLQEPKKNSISLISNIDFELDKEILDARFDLASYYLVNRSFSNYLSNSNGDREFLNKVLNHPLYHHLRTFVNLNSSFVGDLIYYIEQFSLADFSDHPECYSLADTSIYVMLVVLQNSKHKNSLKDIYDLVINSENVWWSRRLCMRYKTKSSN